MPGSYQEVGTEGGPAVPGHPWGSQLGCQGSLPLSWVPLTWELSCGQLWWGRRLFQPVFLLAQWGVYVREKGWALLGIPVLPEGGWGWDSRTDNREFCELGSRAAVTGASGKPVLEEGQVRWSWEKPGLVEGGWNKMGF